MKRTFPHLSTILVACLFAPSALANDSPEGACESKHLPVEPPARP